MLDIGQIAQVCHEANRALQATNGQEVGPTWENAPDWQISSAKNGVLAALEGKTPEELHALWSAEKVEAGWVYGIVKDADIKTHPCLVPYTALPREELIKDYVFSGIVEAFKSAYRIH